MSKEPTFDEDYTAVMKTLEKGKITIPDIPDQFNGSNLTFFFNALIGEDTVKTLRSEFVSWTDTRVGTIREMMDLGIDYEDAVTVKSYLAAAYDASGKGNIERLSFDELGELVAEDYPAPDFRKVE